MGISVSDLTVTLHFEESINFDANAWWDPRGVEIVVDILVVVGGDGKERSRKKLW